MIALALMTAAVLERPPMDRADAAIVAVGTVEKVFTEGAGTGSVERITQIKIERVERNQSDRPLEPGDTLYVYTFETNAAPVLEPGPSGHARFRTKGHRLRVFVMGADGRNEGCYPDWHDVLPPDRPSRR